MARDPFVVEKLDGEDLGAERAAGQPLLFDQIREVVTQLLLGQLIRRSTVASGQLSHRVDVDVLRRRGQGKRLASKTYPVGEISADSSAKYETLQWEVQGQLGGTFSLSAALRDPGGRELPANQQILLIADQEEARKRCQEKAAQWQAHKGRFPSADYYRFFPELSGAERANRFGDAVPRPEYGLGGRRGSRTA